MQYLIGAAILAALGWWGYGRLKPLLGRGEVRIAAGAASALSLGAAAFSASREAWTKVIVLLALGLWMAWLARNGAPSRKAAAPDNGLSFPSQEEARAILGVSATAGREEIQEAYMRLIRRPHPDSGGTSGLAAQLNAARDRLLKT